MAASDSQPTSKNRWSWITNWAAPLAAVGGLAGSLVPDYLQVRLWEVPGFDFKTLFASVRLLHLGGNPYSLTQLRQIFQQDGVVEPANWFGHLPVYPPFTLAVLAPLGALDIAQAARLWFVLSALLMAIGLAVTLRAAERQFSISIWGRLAVLAACVACPLLGFALEIGNVSVAVASLCLLAVYLEEKPVFRGVCLAVALLLKPHIAIWVWIGMLVCPGVWRRIAVLAAAFTAGFILVTSAVLGMQGRLFSTWGNYRAMLAAEVAGGGSMSASSREILPAGAQITSVWSLAGYWGRHASGDAMVFLLLLAAVLCWTLWRMRRADEISLRILAVGCLLSFGMVASYHRAHDALALFVLAPWFAAQLSRRVWVVALGLLAFLDLCVSPGSGWPNLLLYRQGALAAGCLALLLIAFLWQKSKKRPV